MSNHTRIGVKIRSNRFYGVMNPNLLFLIQIIINIYGVDKERGTKVSVYSHI